MRRIASAAVLAVCLQTTGCQMDLLPSEGSESEASGGSTSGDGPGMTSWGGLTGAGVSSTSCWSCTGTESTGSNSGTTDGVHSSTGNGDLGTSSDELSVGSELTDAGGEATTTETESTEGSSSDAEAGESSATDTGGDDESTEVGDASDTSDTVSGSESDPEAGGDNTGGAMVQACADIDRDGFGDPENCSEFAESEVPEDWTVDGAKWTDCDDSDKRTHVGAAEQEHTDKCTKDSDDDGFADDDPPADRPDVVAGSDCNDGSATTHPGAAANEGDRDGCFKDYDGDDWGDADPPTGVEVGSDCDDDNEGIFPGNATNEADRDGCFKDDDDDDWGDNDPDDPDVTPGSDCDDEDDKVGECSTEPVVITLATSAGVKPGDSVRLQPQVMGGSGNYSFQWFTYDPDTGMTSAAVTLNDDDVREPLATPTEPVTHYLLRAADADDPDNYDEARIRIYQEDASIDLNTCQNVDLNPVFSNMDIFPPQWQVADAGFRVCQTENNQPAAFVCPQVVSDAKISAVLQTKHSMDDDWIGFVWGMQSDDSAEPKQFYLFHWRQQNGESHIDCDVSTNQEHFGMYIRKIDESRTGGELNDCDLLVGTQTGDNSTMLQTPENWTGDGAIQGWSVDKDYLLEIEHRRDSSTVTITQLDEDGGRNQLATTTINDSSFPQGKAGLFTFSQYDVCMADLRIEALER